MNIPWKGTLLGGWVGAGFTFFSGYNLWQWQWWVFVVPTIALALLYRYER